MRGRILRFRRKRDLIPTTPGEWWTLLAAISSIVLAFFAGVSLYSLVLTKREGNRIARREKLATAIEQNEKFTTDLVLRFRVIRDDYERCVHGTSGEPDLFEGLIGAAQHQLNMLESWALYIESGSL